VASNQHGTRIVNDVRTSLDLAERALQDSETRLQQVLDNTSAVVFAKDNQGRYLFVNHEFEKLAGRPTDDVLGHTDDEVFPPQIATRFRYNDLRVLHEKRAIEFEESGDFGRGPRTFLSAKFPLFDAEGQIYAVCGVATDITERKRLEEALSSAALAVSTSEADSLYRELARYLATILGVDGAFIATIDPVQPGQLAMLAFHLDGATRENFSYPKVGTPCETVIGHGYRFYPERLRELFPSDLDFGKLGVESYAGHPLDDSAGRPLGLIAVISRHPLEHPTFVESVMRIFAVRVTSELERLAAAESARASQASYREIFEASEDAIFVHDWDTGAILDANPQACAAFGYSREELLRVRLGEISSGMAPYTEAEALRRIEQARRQGSVRFEWHRRSKDGGLHWDEVHLKSAQIGGQRRVLAFTRDVTERKHAEEALRASEEQYRAVFNASADALVLWNSRSERVDVNPAYERMYGYRREEVLAGVRAGELPDAHRELQSQIIELTLAGQSFHGEIETVRRSGERFPIEVRTIPIRYRGEPHVLAMIRDLTERRRVENDRAQLEVQLRQAQKMEAIGQLTGGIAHDFNNLLTSIMGYVTLASEREGALADRRLAGYLAQAQRSCERARDLIQQMLMFSRGQRGSPRTVSLGPLVDDALASVRPALPANVTLSVDVASGAPRLRVDPLQVEQVLLNLCLNARDAIDGTGVVSVSVRPARADGFVCAGCRATFGGDFVELSIADDGHGMAPAVVERIFEPFFSTKETGKGTGMGLAMVHGIVHEHGGHVVVESSPGRGSRFRVLWPALPPDVHETSMSPGAIAPSERRPRPAMTGSVLVVDDEAAVGEFMRELLETWGLQAMFLPQGQAALELLSGPGARFNAVITDQAMPGMTGIQLARALQNSRIDVPVILYSGYGEGLAQADLQAAGVRAVLRKPVDPVALEAALARALAEGAAYSSGTT
jgi:PAS domain S-box-containing protein